MSAPRGTKHTLAPGDYLWCACGECEAQPFSDDPCKGGASAVPFTLEEETTLKVCNCKHSSNPPYCDGTHNRL